MSSSSSSSLLLEKEFNASIAVTSLLTKTLENVAKELAIRCIEECGSKYGFNADEAIKSLGLEGLKLQRKEMGKRSEGKKKKEKVVRIREKKSKIPMPFVGSEVKENGCDGLSYNRGLFTQCNNMKMENGMFCSKCQMEADNSARGVPMCGTIEMRLNSGLYDFKDLKGRKPISYLKLLEKMKISVEEAKMEAGNKNIELGEHLAKSPEKEGRRGRPKKEVGVVEVDNVVDLFAKLAAEDVVEEDVVVEDEKSSKKTAMELKKAQLAEEKEQKRIKIGEEKEQKRKEREEKIAEEKAAREAKRAEEKAAKDAAKEVKKGKKEVEDVAPVAVAVATKVTVSRIQIGGVSYLKSSSNILYNPDTKEEVGLWDPVTKTIQDLPEDEDEEEEEGYESE